jgi:hypothetical protein
MVNLCQFDDLCRPIGKRPPAGVFIPISYTPAASKRQRSAEVAEVVDFLKLRIIK